MSLSEKILSLRTGLGLSQEELAEKLEVSRQSVSKWETGQSVPDLDKLIRLADLFSISVDELVREGERPQPPQPPQPQVVYVKKERQGLTGTQKAGVCLELTGLALDLLGLVGENSLIVFIGAALIVLGLPGFLVLRNPDGQLDCHCTGACDPPAHLPHLPGLEKPKKVENGAVKPPAGKTVIFKLVGTGIASVMPVPLLTAHPRE